MPVSMTSLMDFMLWMGIMDDGWRTTRGASALIAVRQPFYGKLVVEETHMGECHGDAILVAGVDDMVVADATASLCDKLYTAAVGTLDVVAEGEESIRSQGHARVLGDPCLALLAGQRFGLFGKELLPCAVAEDVLGLVADIEVDAVVAVCTANLLLEWQIHDLRVLAQPPFVSLASCQSGAVDAALLTGSDTDGLSVLDVADRVALRIFQRDESDDQVALSLGVNVLFFVGMSSKSDGSSRRTSLRPCSKVTPNTCLRSMGAGGVGGSIWMTQ